MFIAAALKGLVLGLGKMALSYLPVVLWELFFDLLDEGMLTLLESAEAKAKASPEIADDRRLALYRKYWENFKEYRNRTGKPE
jgi:hypothetical protein